MKLHLPIALLAAVVVPSISMAEQTIVDVDKSIFTTVNTTTGSNGETYINVGKHTVKDGAMTTPDIRLYTPDTDDKTLHLKDGDKVGIITGTGTLDTTSASNVLYIDGNLEVGQGAQVHLAGKGGVYDFGGLIAEDVTVQNGGTLKLDAARMETLKVNGGTVNIHVGNDNGTPYQGAGIYAPEVPGYETAAGYYFFGNLCITEGLEVEGGSLTVGKSHNDGIPGNVEYARGYNGTYYQSSINGGIKQSEGVLKLIGHTYVNANEVDANTGLKTFKITQSGGDMTIAQRSGFSTALLEDENGNEITQKEVAGYLRVANDTDVVSITQEGDDSTLNLQGIICKGSDKTGAMQLVVEQSGGGTINMQSGREYDRLKDDKKTHILSNTYIGSHFTTGDAASQINQTGNGKININSDYTSATFNVKQSGEGTITVGEHGKLSSSELTLNTSSTFSIAGELNLQNNALINVIYDTEDLLGDAAIQLNGGVLSIEDVEACVSVSLTESAITANMMETYAATGSFTFTVDLISGMEKEKALEFIENLKTGIAYSDITISGTQLLADGVEASQLSLMFTTEKFLVDETTGAIQAVVTASTSNIPEPTTATLSLLALAALAARRRRR